MQAYKSISVIAVLVMALAQIAFSQGPPAQGGASPFSQNGQQGQLPFGLGNTNGGGFGMPFGGGFGRSGSGNGAFGNGFGSGSGSGFGFGQQGLGQQQQRQQPGWFGSSSSSSNGGLPQWMSQQPSFYPQQQQQPGLFPQQQQQYDPRQMNGGNSFGGQGLGRSRHQS